MRIDDRRPGQRARIDLRTLAVHPIPLVCPPAGIGLVWSAKSACSVAVSWFLACAGLLDEANRLAAWPHRYRQTLGTRDFYRDWMQSTDGLRWVRVIRDPYRRAVSSFRYAVRKETSDGLFTGRKTLTFNEMLETLLGAEGVHLDLHLRRQRHPIESQIDNVTVINADHASFTDALLAVRRPTDAMAAAFAEKVEELARNHKTVRYGTDGDWSNVGFERLTDVTEWPDFGAFLTRETRAKIERLYAADFAAYARFL